MEQTGHIIVLEGPDGVGKTSVAQGLVEHLKARKVPAVYLAFPGHAEGTLGSLVYELYHHPDRLGVRKMDPASVQVLHVAAHVDALRYQIEPALAKGQTIILDRYWWSTLVYGRVTGADEKFLSKLIDLEVSAWGTVRPDLILLLTRQQTLKNEPDMGSWQALSEAYRQTAETEARTQSVEVLHNNRPFRETLVEAIATVESCLNMEPTLGCPDTSDPHNGSGRPSETLPLFGNHAQPTTPCQTGPLVFSRLSPACSTEVYDTYWRFAAERQEVFYRRLEGANWPWTEDDILQRYKFTNAYRAADRVSQYLIQHVIYNGDMTPEELFFRTLLFKVFNRVETWELLEKEFGTVSWLTYDHAAYDMVLRQAREGGKPIFSAAYMMSSTEVFGLPAKHQNYLKLIEVMIRDEVPEQIQRARKLRQVFELLRSYPMMGDFLAYQYTIDLNYSPITDFSESEFVVPGPGARDGIRKCFSDLGGLTEADIIRVVTNRQEEEFAQRGLNFRSLWGRHLQLIDCQNLFCEVDKYARVAHPDAMGRSGRTRIKQTYKGDRGRQEFWFPPKWAINEAVSRGTWR